MNTFLFKIFLLLTFLWNGKCNLLRSRNLREYSDTEMQNDTIYCETPSVPKGLFDVVIAGYKHREPDEYSYLFGLTNVNFYHYRRQFAYGSPLKHTKEMCGVQVYERLIIPNHGREASAFYDYVIERYDDPPMSLAFMHGHAAISWHSTCLTTYARLISVYRSIAVGTPFLRMISLSGNQKQNKLDFHRRLNYLIRSSDVIAQESIEEQEFEKRIVQDNEEIDLMIGDKCWLIFKRFNYTQRSGYVNHTYSSAATFILPGSRLRWYSKEFYLAMRAYHLDTTMDDNLEGRYCFEFIIWNMFGDNFIGEEEVEEKSWYANASALAKTFTQQHSIYEQRLRGCRAKEAPGVEE